jgi:hypothetical protein
MKYVQDAFISRPNCPFSRVKPEQRHGKRALLSLRD